MTDAFSESEIFDDQDLDDSAWPTQKLAPLPVKVEVLPPLPDDGLKLKDHEPTRPGDDMKLPAPKNELQQSEELEELELAATNSNKAYNKDDLKDDSVAPSWGWREQVAGRVGHVDAGTRLSAPTTQACGLFPFVAGSGSPKIGVPVGLHLLNREIVCMDPFRWVQHGMATNPGIFMVAQPGCGKSALVKRLITGMSGFGAVPIVLGDVKPDYPGVIEALGGQVIRMGRGLDVINPLDAGPIKAASVRLRDAGFTEKADELEADAYGRRLALLVAICEVGRSGTPVSPGEEVMLAASIRHLDAKGIESPTVQDILELLRDAPDTVVAAAESENKGAFKVESKELRQTLSLLLTGTFKGIFDGPTTQPINLDAPAIEIDISALARSGEENIISSAMLAVWAYGFGVVDAQMALSEAGLEPARDYIAVLDELWRALRGAPGLVDRADALTRVNRSRGMAQVMVTHSLDDLEALPTEQDRKKARGLIERSGTIILGGMSPREAQAISQVMPLSQKEQGLLTSWQSPSSWAGNEAHPGRGRFMIKTGAKTGLPIQVVLLPIEEELYNTDRIAGVDR